MDKFDVVCVAIIMTRILLAILPYILNAKKIFKVYKIIYMRKKVIARRNKRIHDKVRAETHRALAKMVASIKETLERPNKIHKRIAERQKKIHKRIAEREKAIHKEILERPNKICQGIAGREADKIRAEADKFHAEIRAGVKQFIAEERTKPRRVNLDYLKKPNNIKN